MDTQRAYNDTDTSLTVWLRSDAGRIDFTGKELSVALYAYGVPGVLTTYDATGSNAGAVTWTVPADSGYGPGLFRYAVTADGVNVGGGLLEII